MPYSQSLLSIPELFDRYQFEFIEDVAERLTCIICKRVLRNAKQTSCGCKVCDKCISDYLKNDEKSCPAEQCDSMNSKLTLARDVHQDDATNKEIANLKVKCPFKLCDFVDTLRKMLPHIDCCECREVICDLCNKGYSFKEKDVHDRDECDKRIVDCPYCKERMAAILLDTAHLNVDHSDLCSKYYGDCSNDCGATNVNLKEHLKTCTNKKVECPFEYFHCHVGKLTTVNLMKHLQEELGSHLSNLISEFIETKKDNDTLKESVNRLETITKEKNQTIQKLTEGRIKTDKSIEELRSRSSGTASSSEEIIIFLDAPYVWKITNFESKKSEAENGMRASVTSEAFYTSEFGYKMCLRIYPGGDGVGRGTHLSVFFAIMKGDYDDILTWPFKQKVTLSLIDQENYGSKNHSDTFKPDARSACYQKPVDECNIASGSSKFIPLSSLSPYSMFCKNDTVFIKISVDTIDHSDLCSKYYGDRSNDCGATNVNLKEYTKTCTSKKVGCPFEYFHCHVGKLTTANLMKHLQEELGPHLSNLIKELQDLKEDNVKLSESVNRLETITKEQNQAIHKLAEGRITTGKSIEELRSRSCENLAQNYFRNSKVPRYRHRTVY